MNKSVEFYSILELLKDNQHCPAHRNCDICNYNNGGCALMHQVDKLIKGGVMLSPPKYELGQIVYLIVPYLPTPYRCIIEEIRWTHYGSSKKKQKVLTLNYQRKNHKFFVIEEDFEKKVFFNKEDAMNVISEWKKNGLR